MKKKIIVIVGLILATALIVQDQIVAQTTPPLDDNEFIQRIERTGNNFTEITQIGRSTVDGSIWTVIETNGVETNNRLADSFEQQRYLNAEQFDKVERWVNNRIAEMIQCEVEGNSGLALGNWSNLTNGQKNAVINSLLDCQEQTSIIIKKVLPELLEMFRELQTNG